LKVIYLAGRYRDPRGAFYIHTNILEAERHALWIWLHGAAAICPHKNTAFFDGAHGIPDEVWLEGDKEILRRCDAVFAMPGWDSSKGARAEVELAQELNIPILYDQADILRYLGEI
jgi:hypothetical protein